MTFVMIDLYDFSEIKKGQEQGSILMGLNFKSIP